MEGALVDLVVLSVFGSPVVEHCLRSPPGCEQEATVAARRSDQTDGSPMSRPFGPPTGAGEAAPRRTVSSTRTVAAPWGVAGDRAPTALDCEGGPRTRARGVDDRDLGADDRDRTAEDRDQVAEAHDRASEARDERAQARDRRAEARDRAATDVATTSSRPM